MKDFLDQPLGGVSIGLMCVTSYEQEALSVFEGLSGGFVAVDIRHYCDSQFGDSTMSACCSTGETTHVWSVMRGQGQLKVVMEGSAMRGSSVVLDDCSPPLVYEVEVHGVVDDGSFWCQGPDHRQICPGHRWA